MGRPLSIAFGLAVAALMVPTAPGCGNCTVVRASSFDQSCKVDADCAAVIENSCCANAAVNVHAVVQFEAAVANGACHPALFCDVSCGVAVACCNVGTCGLAEQCTDSIELDAAAKDVAADAGAE